MQTPESCNTFDVLSLYLIRIRSVPRQTAHRVSGSFPCLDITGLSGELQRSLLVERIGWGPFSGTAFPVRGHLSKNGDGKKHGTWIGEGLPAGGGVVLVLDLLWASVGFAAL